MGGQREKTKLKAKNQVYLSIIGLQLAVTFYSKHTSMTCVASFEGNSWSGVAHMVIGVNAGDGRSGDD